MTAQEFVFKTAPYKIIKGEEYEELYKELSTYHLSVNGYNPLRHVDTTYHLCSNTISAGHGNYSAKNKFEPEDDNIRVLSFKCGRFEDILTLVVYVNREESTIMKIGTFPSLKDFRKDDIKKYDKVLNDQQKTELVTAITIANNGVGIGSYVYLRRLFEGIVYEESQRAIADGVINKDEFDTKKMDEKIVAIKNYLPGFLYENHKALYGILSIGIHQLDEEACLSYFSVLYDCIILILDDRLAQKEREIMSKKAAASLDKIVSKLKK